MKIEKVLEIAETINKQRAIQTFLDEHPDEAFFLKELLQKSGIKSRLNGPEMKNLEKLGYSMKLSAMKRIYATPKALEKIREAIKKWETET